MAIYLKPFWRDENKTMNAFAVESGIAVNTVKRWAEELPLHPSSYLTLCLLLDCSPQKLIDKEFNQIARAKGFIPGDIAALCGFNPFTFDREMSSTNYPIATALLQLDKIYKYCNGFEMAFDVDAIKADVIDRVNRIANAIAA